jgi:hypothetical protein
MPLAAMGRFRSVVTDRNRPKADAQQHNIVVCPRLFRLFTGSYGDVAGSDRGLTRSAQQIVDYAAGSLPLRQENSPTPYWRIDERLQKLRYSGGEANERTVGNPAMPTSSIPPDAAHERTGSQYIGRQKKPISTPSKATPTYESKPRHPDSDAISLCNH